MNASVLVFFCLATLSPFLQPYHHIYSIKLSKSRVKLVVFSSVFNFTSHKGKISHHLYSAKANHQGMLFAVSSFADLADVFLKPETALSLLSSSSGKQSGAGNRRKSLRRQRLGVRGIMDECCDVQAGCSWEEYAEYCPTSRRIRN